MNLIKQASRILVLLLFLSSLSCEKEIFDCDTKEGEKEIRTVVFDRIEGFEIEADVSLQIIEGDLQKIEVNSYSNIIDKLVEDSRVDNDILKIDYDGCLRGLDTEDIKIIATVTELTTVKIDGSGKVFIENTFTNISDLNLEISGSGDMNLNLGSAMDEVDVDISGSGKIAASGKADELKIDLSGSGSFMGSDLETRLCEVEISGSGNCAVFVEELLTVDISGSGAVCYKGTPTVDSDLSGSGGVENCN